NGSSQQDHMLRRCHIDNKATQLAARLYGDFVAALSDQDASRSEKCLAPDFRFTTWLFPETMLSRDSFLSLATSLFSSETKFLRSTAERHGDVLLSHTIIEFPRELSFDIPEGQDVCAVIAGRQLAYASA